MRVRLSIIVTVPLILSAALSMAQPAGLPRLQHDLVRRTYQVVAGKSPDVAYLASTVGVVAVDIRDPVRPDYAGVLPLPDSINDLALAGDRLVAATGPSGIVVVDVSDPTGPKKLGALKVAGAAMGLCSLGDRVLVASGTAGLHLVDIANPSKPRRVAHMETPGYARAVVARGDRIYLADGSAGVHILALTGDRLTRTASIPTQGHVFDVVVADDQVIVAAGSAGVSRYNVKDPKTPRLTGTLPVKDSARGLAVLGQRVAVANSTRGLAILDISGDTLREIGRHKPKRSVNSVALVRDLALLANDYDGLLVLRLPEKGAPLFAGALPPRTD